MIRVKDQDGTTRKIPSNQLDELIREERIQSFERASGWVEVDAGPIRKDVADLFCVPERRSDLAYRLLIADLDQPLEPERDRTEG